MSKAASNPTRIAQQAAIEHHRQQQQLRAMLGVGTGQIKVDNPNRAQRRAAKKQEGKT